MFHTRWSERILIYDGRKLRLSVHMCNFVSSPNHIFVSCQNITIKVSKCYWFQGSFSSGFDHFLPAGLFQKLAKPCEGVWPCIDGLRFSCALRRYDSEVFDGDFLPSKNEGKDLYVQRKKCHRSGYFSHIENFSCEQCNHILDSRRLVRRPLRFDMTANDQV